MPRRSRRQFIRDLTLGAAAATGALSVPSFPSFASPGSPEPLGEVSPGHPAFLHGVASGDPLARRVILWTRVTTERPGRVAVLWELALEPGFGQVQRSGVFITGPERDYTVKVDAAGLAPDTAYFYRFRLGGLSSPVGRTRTLPEGPVEQVKLVVFSCSNYPAGYFHAYRAAAQVEGVRAAVHLGDYLYEYQRGSYASEDAAELEREVLPAHELLSLEDYRRRHAQYRGDPDLQALHAALPFICVWDDHEVANDSWRGGADNHDPATEGDFFARRAAALQAYHEWMPVRLADPADPLRIARSFDFGELLSLHMIDTRHVARDRQLYYGNFLAADGRLDAAAFSAALLDPARQLLGVAQTGWLEQALARSGAHWQVLGQQVLMGPMHVPAPLALGQIGVAPYAALLRKAAADPATLTPDEQALLAQPVLPYNLDAWDGYPAAREAVLGMARRLDKNLVVLAGDTHNAWASNLADAGGTPVGVEFATASVSSPGLEEYVSEVAPAELAASFVDIVGPLQYAETTHRGFMVVTASAEACQAEWRFVSTVKAADHEVFAGATWQVRSGQRVLEEVVA